LDAVEVVVDNGSFISKLTQTDGIIKAETDLIYIGQDQVVELPDRLATIEDTINVDNNSKL
jgi:hypothetical protein